MKKKNKKNINENFKAKKVIENLIPVSDVSEILKSIEEPYINKNLFSLTEKAFKTNNDSISELFKTINPIYEKYNTLDLFSSTIDEFKPSFDSLSGILETENWLSEAFTTSNSYSAFTDVFNTIQTPISSIYEALNPIEEALNLSSYLDSTTNEYEENFSPIMKLYGNNIPVKELNDKNVVNVNTDEEKETNNSNFDFSNFSEKYKTKKVEQRKHIFLKEFIEEKITKEELIEEKINELIQVIKEDVFESGEISESEDYIREIADEIDLDFSLQILNKAYTKYFSNSHIMRGILHIISHFEYEEVDPIGVSIAIGSISHKNIFVVDFAIKAFENWNNKKSLVILKSIDGRADWLNDYIGKVIKNIEIYGA